MAKKARIRVAEFFDGECHWVRLTIDGETALLNLHEADDIANRLRYKAFKMRQRALDAWQDEATRRPVK